MQPSLAVGLHQISKSKVFQTTTDVTKYGEDSAKFDCSLELLHGFERLVCIDVML
jgi:hypothetical protein